MGTIVLAVSEAQLNYFYKSRAAVNGALGFPRAYGGSFGYNGYRGYSGFRGYGGYGGYGYSGYRGKRSADSEPEDEGYEGPNPDAAQSTFYEYPKMAQTYGYPYGRYFPHGNGYFGYHSFGRFPGYYY